MSFAKDFKHLLYTIFALSIRQTLLSKLYRPRLNTTYFTPFIEQVSECLGQIRQLCSFRAVSLFIMLQK